MRMPWAFSFFRPAKIASVTHLPYFSIICFLAESTKSIDRFGHLCYDADSKRIGHYPYFEMSKNMREVLKWNKDELSS
jgi:hypothetical protein